MMGERYAGRWVKEADADLTKDLARGTSWCTRSRTGTTTLLLAQRRRPADPAGPAGLVHQDHRANRGAIANNQQVFWLPEHIKDGRSETSWITTWTGPVARALLGTPLNVWVCTADADHKHAPSSVAEIERLNPNAFEHFHQASQADPSLSEHLIVHKPWIDHVTFPCPTCGAAMKRVPEVIDCWFDSGCMRSRSGVPAPARLGGAP